MGINGRDRIENGSIKSKIKMMGPICRTRKKAAAAVLHKSSVEEDIDPDMQLRKERCFDDDESMWLSSDSSSLSTFFEERRLSTLLHIAVDDWLILWFSALTNSHLHLDTSSTLSYASSVLYSEGLTPSSLERTNQDAEKIFQQDSRNDEHSALVPNSLVTDAVDSSVTDCEDSTSFDNSLMPCSTIFDSPSSSQISDSDRMNFLTDSDKMNFLTSLVNLDGEESKWISDTELESDYFQSDFPSPSCNRTWDYKVLSSSSNVSTPSDLKYGNLKHDITSDHAPLESSELEDLHTDEPLFWPFDLKLDWSSEETWKCFSISPRNSTIKLGAPQWTSSKSNGPKFHKSRMYSEEGCRRRLVFSSGSAASKILEWKQRNNSTGRRNINPLPSRLRKSTKTSMKIVPLEMEDDIKETKDGKASSSPKLNCTDSDFLEDEFASKAELPIEKLLGLNEFDGHEGVDSEFNEDVFSLDDSLS